MLVDTSVARNFAILDWTDLLVALCGGTILVAHGILGLDETEAGELELALHHFEREMRMQPGSPRSSRAAAAATGLGQLIARRGRDLQVVRPMPGEYALAARLQDPAERAWLRSLGVRERRLDAGEAISTAIATSRGESFATDDEAGRAAYLSLGGEEHLWTLDLIQRGVGDGLIREDEARAGYALLCEEYDFWGAAWD